MGDKYVVTAAHCLKGYGPGDVAVLIGDTSIAVENEAQSMKINALYFKRHPQYNSTSHENDIAVIELEDVVDLLLFSNIKPACLPSAGKTFGGQLAVVSGWGRETVESDMVANLNEVSVRIYADGSCGLMDYYKSEDMLCAGVVEGGMDACIGDSGGPLVTPDQENNGAATLVGVVSWGLGCAEKNRLGLYAEVSHFRPWLDEVLSSLVTCPPPPSSSWRPTMTQHTHGNSMSETDDGMEVLIEKNEVLENNIAVTEEQIELLEDNKLLLENNLEVAEDQNYELEDHLILEKEKVKTLKWKNRKYQSHLIRLQEAYQKLNRMLRDNSC